MTIVLQCLSTGKFVTEGGWTADRRKATQFESVEDAEEFCWQCGHCQRGAMAIIELRDNDYLVPIPPQKKEGGPATQ